MLPDHLKTEEYPWYVRVIFWLQRRKYGDVLNSSRYWAQSPSVFLTLSLFYGTLDRKSSPISPAMRSLIIVRVSQLNGCSFCIDLNTSVLLERGLAVEKVQDLHRWRESFLFSDEEKVLLDYAEAVTNSKGDIGGHIKSQMVQHFTDKELVEITALIAFQNMSTKVNNAFGIDPQGFCSLERK